ncbi:MAG: IclR family transcriptional regulator [Rhodospirillales bacterium]
MPRPHHPKPATRRGHSGAAAAKQKGGASAKGGAYAVEAISRATDILFAFSHAEPELSLTEIVARTRLPKTTTFRILSTLCHRGLCMQDPLTGHYSLGFELLHLADIRRRQANLRNLAMPVMRSIRDRVKETVVFSIRSGDFRIHIDFAEGLHPMRRMVELGRQVPLYVGAASKVLFAGLSDAEIEAYLKRTPLEKFSEKTITEPKVLWREIESIRKRGYAESKSELFNGGASIAAPIMDYTGGTVAVIDIITPEGRNSKPHHELCRKLLLGGTGALSEQLGYHGGD